MSARAHYPNGRPVAIGDHIVGRNSSGAFIGYVYAVAKSGLLILAPPSAIPSSPCSSLCLVTVCVSRTFCHLAFPV